MIKYGLQYIYSRMEKGVLLNNEIYNYLIKKDQILYNKLIGTNN